MFKEGKEIISVDNKDFIRLADAMQVIAPTTTNASRWFQQHQEAFSPETFVYSDERFPGKKNRVWLTVPEGFQVLHQACVNAPRLKIPEGVEYRIAPFVIEEGRLKNVLSVSTGLDLSVSQPCRKLCETDKSSSCPPTPAPPKGGDGQKEVDNEVDIEFDAVDEASLVKRTNKVGFAPRNEIRDTDLPTQPRGIVYQEPQEKMILPTSEIPNSQFPIPNSECLVAFDTHSESSCQKQQKEEWVEFLQQSLSDLVASYYTKMCWLKHAQTEAPLEIQAGFTDLTNTLHDTLIENVIADILKYKEPVPCEAPTCDKIPLPPLGKGESKLLDQVEEYLSEGYEISFEVDKEGVLCRVLSGSIGVNAIALNWQEAFEKATIQLRRLKNPPTPFAKGVHNVPDSLYTLNIDGNVELTNDMGEIQ